MADLNKDAISHKGQKRKKYSLAVKKEVIAYAETHGNRPASRRFQVDEKRVREWRGNKAAIEGLITTKKGKERSRLTGGGRKPLSTELEVLLGWIESRRSRGLRVSLRVSRILSATAPVPMLKSRTLQLCWCWILITKETVTLKLSELIIELNFYDFLGAQQVVVLIL